MNFMYKLIILSVLITLLACSDKEKTTVISNDSAYSSAKFSPSDQYKTHQVAAFVVPTDQASLSFQISGIIDEQFIRIGDQVTADQNLFKVSNPSLEPQIQQFRSQIDAINATLEQNKAEVSRFKDLKKSNAISQNDLDRLTNQSDNLKASRKSLEAQLEQAQSMFDETYLKAPFAGNIAEVYKEAGEVISPGEPVLIIGGITSLEAAIFVPADLQRNLASGKVLTVKYHDKPIEATVKELSQSANPKSQLFKVMLDVPIEHGIKSGEKITVQIKELMGSFFKLPIESVIDDGINQPFIFTIENQQVIHTPIKLIEIINNEVIIELEQDNKRNDIEVVTAGQNNLSPQQLLKINPQKAVQNLSQSDLSETSPDAQ